MARASVREQLIEAGLDTLHLQGFNGCSVQEITDAAEVPKGSFYNHFESKEQFALEALERYWENSASLRSSLNDTNIDPIERLRRHFQALATYADQYNYLRGCLIGNFSSELSQNREIRDRLAGMYAAWTRSIESCVQEANRAGRLQQCLSPADVSQFLVNAWEGAVLRSKVEQNKSSFEQFERIIFASIFI